MRAGVRAGVRACVRACVCVCFSGVDLGYWKTLQWSFHILKNTLRLLCYYCCCLSFDCTTEFLLLLFVVARSGPCLSYTWLISCRDWVALSS